MWAAGPLPIMHTFVLRSSTAEAGSDSDAVDDNEEANVEADLGLTKLPAFFSRENTLFGFGKKFVPTRDLL